jgi:polyhydroxyalkanoate synthesis regulator phasin
MFDYLKKSILAGVGFALKSKAEIGELTEEFAKKSNMNKDEAKKFLNEYQKRYEDVKQGLDQKIESSIESIMERLDLPKRADIQKLNERIDKLAGDLTRQKE